MTLHSCLFFFHHTATTEIYTLSLHDALPIFTMREELRQLWTRTNVSAEQLVADLQSWCKRAEESGIAALQEFALRLRSEEHTSELQSRLHLVCRLLLEKKKKKYRTSKNQQTQ